MTCFAVGTVHGRCCRVNILARHAVLQEDDPDIVPGLQWSLDNDITDILDLSFTVTREIDTTAADAGDGSSSRLKPKPPPGKPKTQSTDGDGGASAPHRW